MTKNFGQEIKFSPLHQKESSNIKSKAYTESSQYRTNAASTQGIDIYILRDILPYQTDNVDQTSRTLDSIVIHLMGQGGDIYTWQ